MTVIEDKTTDTVTLADGDSVTLQLETRVGDQLFAFVDDGAGNTPAQYDLVIERYSPFLDGSSGGWMPFTSVTGGTEVSHEFSCPAYQCRLTVTNTSGSESAFRVEALSETYARA